MSIRIMAHIWDHAAIDGNSLLVLLALADFADDDGLCWPSMATIAQKARVSERGARGIIRRLETSGLLACEPSKGRESNHYRIITNPEATSGSKATNPEDRAGLNPETVAGLKPSNPEDSDIQPGSSCFRLTLREPPKKTLKKESRAFSDFWSAYPKHTEKKSAAAKFEIAVKSGVDPQHIINAAARYADHVAVNRTEDRYIKHPTTWLNKGCWDDELKPDKPLDNRGPSRKPTASDYIMAELKAQDEAEAARGA